MLSADLLGHRARSSLFSHAGNPVPRLSSAIIRGAKRADAIIAAVTTLDRSAELSKREHTVDIYRIRKSAPDSALCSVRQSRAAGGKVGVRKSGAKRAVERASPKQHLPAFRRVDPPNSRGHFWLPAVQTSRWFEHWTPHCPTAARIGGLSLSLRPSSPGHDAAAPSPVNTRQETCPPPRHG